MEILQEVCHVYLSIELRSWRKVANSFEVCFVTIITELLCWQVLLCDMIHKFKHESNLQRMRNTSYYVKLITDALLSYFVSPPFLRTFLVALCVLVNLLLLLQLFLLTFSPLKNEICNQHTEKISNSRPVVADSFIILFLNIPEKTKVINLSWWYMIV